jgi:hypothetical protein
MGMSKTPERTSGSAHFDAKVRIRRIPYPFRGMMAVCSDLDETPDRESYIGLMTFLNTVNVTPMGRGLGLEIGNSIYFDMPPDQFAYWNTDETGREAVRRLIRSGHVDCIHSFGDNAKTREDARRALKELERHNCHIRVWVDHATAPTNFGMDIMNGHGAEKAHSAYHADLSREYGIRYVWTGRVTSVIGQDCPFDLGGIADVRHPLKSAQTLFKEYAKHMLAICGSRKYTMHGSNQILVPCTLHDNSMMYEFLRCNPHWGGVSSCERADGINEVLTEKFFRCLMRKRGVCILYTHLGKNSNKLGRPLLDTKAISAFRRLVDYRDKNKILVSTTRRVLDYMRMSRELSVCAMRNGDIETLDLRINRRNTEDPDNGDITELQGLTFYKTNDTRMEIRLNGEIVPDIVENDPDETGKPSLSIPWRPLNFPKLQ